jgi:hypothetical protein
VDGKVPDQVAKPTITTDNQTTTTYTWSAPYDGGLPIIKYGYRVYKDNGTAGSEVLTADGSVLSYSFNSQYDTSIYKIDVRAYNSLGAGEWSTVSNNNVAWVENNVTRSQSCSCTGTDYQCDSCGSRSYTTTGGTQSRNCKYKSKTGYTPTYDGPDYGCDANFGACGSCTGTTTYGSCSGYWEEKTVSGTYNGVAYTAFSPAFYSATFLYRNDSPGSGPSGGCGCDSYYGYSVYQCTVTGAWRVIDQGCIQWTPACGGS